MTALQCPCCGSLLSLGLVVKPQDGGGIPASGTAGGTVQLLEPAAPPPPTTRPARSDNSGLEGNQQDSPSSPRPPRPPRPKYHPPAPQARKRLWDALRDQIGRRWCDGRLWFTLTYPGGAGREAIPAPKALRTMNRWWDRTNRLLRKEYGSDYSYLRLVAWHKDGTPHLHVLTFGAGGRSFPAHLEAAWRKAGGGFVHVRREAPTHSPEALTQYIVDQLATAPRGLHAFSTSQNWHENKPARRSFSTMVQDFLAAIPAITTVARQLTGGAS